MPPDPIKPPPALSTAKDRRRPIARIEFRQPVELEGIGMRLQRLVPGDPLPLAEGVKCPAILFDPELRCIVIGDDLYPLEGVLRFRLAKAAKG